MGEGVPIPAVLADTGLKVAWTWSHNDPADHARLAGWFAVDGRHAGHFGTGPPKGESIFHSNKNDLFPWLAVDLTQ